MSDWVNAPLQAAAADGAPSRVSQTQVEQLQHCDTSDTACKPPSPASPGLALSTLELDSTSTAGTSLPLRPEAQQQHSNSSAQLHVTEVTEVAPGLAFGSGPRLLVVTNPIASVDTLNQADDSPRPSPGQVAPPLLAANDLAKDSHHAAATRVTLAPEPGTAAGATAARGCLPDAGAGAGDAAPGDLSSESLLTIDSWTVKSKAPDLQHNSTHDDDHGIAQTHATASALSSTLRKASQSFKNVVAGDDDEVFDKWDNYDDDLEAEPEAAKMSKSSRAMSGASGKVHPASPASGKELGSMPANFTARSLSTLQDVMSEKRSSRTLVWQYSQTFLFSLLLTAVCIPIVTLVSLVTWHEVDDTAAPDGTQLLNGTATVMAGIRPNQNALQWMLLLQVVFPLCIYALLLYACIRRSFVLPWPMVLLVGFTMAWATLVCGLFYKFDVAFWFYYIDLFLIVAAYVPCMCMVGWYVEVDENASVRTRLMDVAITAALETVVAAATLVYCFFIMPLFFMLTNAWLQMLWLCVIHPLYFEATTGFIVRKMLQRNRQLGRNHILYLLTIVHSMVHTVVLATSLQASIEPVKILALTALLYNLSKLIWRSTVIPRDLLVERLFRGWSFNYPEEELAVLQRMVSVGIITEIIIENASIFIAPFLMFRMYKEPIFMAVVPNTFFSNGGSYPVKTLLVLIAMLLSFTMLFDLLFYFLNYHTNQRLPLINTWRRIKRSQGWYLMFLVYAFATMGVLFLFLTMMILPRAAYCRTDNYCDCSTLTYRTICEGQYISTLVDYLVAP